MFYGCISENSNVTSFLKKHKRLNYTSYQELSIFLHDFVYAGDQNKKRNSKESIAVVVEMALGFRLCGHGC